jgi:integrase
MSLGEVDAISLKEARKTASRIIGQVRNGADPLAEREARANAPRRLTVGDLIERYMSQYAERHHGKRTLVETKRCMNVHLSPLHRLEIDAVTRRDVASILDRLVTTSGPITANRVRGMTSKLFSWAMEQGLAGMNPVAGTARPAPERSRDRILSEEEMRWIWRATDSESDYHKVIRLLLLTGQRRDEVAAMCWSEINVDGSTWTLPATRTKNHREHIVPLSRQTQAILANVERRPGREHVFGRGAGGYSGYSRSKAALDRRIAVMRAQERLGRSLRSDEEPDQKGYLPDWRLHDLRRTCATGMAEIGVAPHIVEACLNHISGHKAGVAGVYNRATYSAEKRAALQRWADHIDDIIGGQRHDNVIIQLGGTG